MTRFTRDHDWTLTELDDSGNGWSHMRECRHCHDRVWTLRFRPYAIYQLGNDTQHVPHAIGSDWKNYAPCRSHPTDASKMLEEPLTRYVAPRKRERSRKPIDPQHAVVSLLERVKDARRVTDDELAEMLEIDCRQINRWRNGSQPSGYAVLKLARLALWTRDPHVIRPLLRRHRA